MENPLNHLGVTSIRVPANILQTNDIIATTNENQSMKHVNVALEITDATVYSDDDGFPEPMGYFNCLNPLLECIY